MFRRTFRKPQSILFCSAVPAITTMNSVNSVNSVNSINKTDDNASAKMKEFVFVETGWDRVRNIFKPTKHEAFSPELRVINSLTSAGLFVGSILGSFIFSRRTYMHFMENNHGSQFESHLDAKAVLTNNMIRSMIRGAMIWGGRTALLTLSWVFVTRAIGAYQNKNGLHNNIGGGIVTGALAGYLLRDLKKLQIDKTFQRGRFVGGSFSIIGGAAIGCLIGGAWGTVQTFNRTESYQSSIRYWEKYWSAYEQEKRKQDPNYKPDN